MLNEQQPVAANTPFTITLEAQQWNGVISALVKAPYEMAAPLIQAITGQLQQQSSAVSNGAGMVQTPLDVPPMN
jgi:hypothetical protein